MGAPLRLTPTMVSRKLQALDFIKRYFAEYGGSPSLGEIAAALGVSRQRADRLVQQLSHEQQIRRVAGKGRGIVLIDKDEEVSEAEVLLRLARSGWRIDGGERTVTKRGLPELPYLDHDPERDIGAGLNDNHDEPGSAG